MSSMKSLINLSKWKVDEIRIHLREAESKVDEVIEKIAKLDQQIFHEQQFLSEQETPFIGAYSSFTRATQTYKTQLKAKLNELEKEVTARRDELRKAFQELKKYEKVDEDIELEENYKEVQRAQEDADEKSLWKSRNWG